MAIESKNLLVWVKAMSRGQALPLDASEVYSSYDEAVTYAGSATAYAGQTVKALLADGKYHSYTLQPSDAGYVLEEVGALKASDLKQFVKVVDSLPTTGQEQGVLYITGKTGAIWTGIEWRIVFWDCDIYGVESRIMGHVNSKAPIANPVFTGTVTLAADPTDNLHAATKQYVDRLIDGLVNTAPGVAGTGEGQENFERDNYRAGQTWRVAEAGEYVGHKCEVGDLIICLADTISPDADSFMVVQANVDGAVTSSANATTVGEIVVFDANTGKVVKGSGVQIASLNDAISKVHAHTNKAKLDTYDKTQTELLASAKSQADALISELEKVVDNKADVADTLAGYGITDAYTSTVIDNKLKVITDNLNTKVSTSDVESKISIAKQEILQDTDKALEDKIGTIPEGTTVKSYVDTAVQTCNTTNTQAIATAKQEAINTAKTYANEKVKGLASETYVTTQIENLRDEVTEECEANLLESRSYTNTKITEVYNAMAIVEF